MKIIVNDKKIDLSNDQLDSMYLGEGLEGVVYQYDDYAFKIHNNWSHKVCLDEDTATKLSSISTSRIVLPKGNIYDENHKFIGYYMDYITSNPLSHISNMRMKYFINEVAEIERDIDVLSDAHFDIDDFHRNNLMYDGEIHIIDPGSYYYDKSKSTYFLKYINRLSFNKFLVEDVLSQGISLKRRKILNDKIPCEEILSDYFLLEADSRDTVKSFVKKIIS